LVAGEAARSCLPGLIAAACGYDWANWLKTVDMPAGCTTETS
jgi:hypothetical protein